MKRGIILVILILFWFSDVSNAEVKNYVLRIQEKKVNFSGTSADAIVVNGVMPAPTLEFTEGDIAKISVINELDTETSVHWHGILLPNRQDGVSYLTTPPIKAHQKYDFEFPIIQSGTYWYHSHTLLQEQQGVFGPIVIHPKNDERKLREATIVFSDWTDEDPMEVLRTLKSGSHYYASRKDALPTWIDAIKLGKFQNILSSEWSRMPPMDISDVAYDAFLVNGKKEEILDVAPGEKIKLRIINAAAATYFYLQVAQQPLNIIAADGIDVRPTNEDRLLMAIAETYDVIVTAPERGAIELRATSQDGSGKVSAFIGAGERILAPDVPRPDPYMNHGEHSAHSGHDMSGHNMHMNHHAMDDRPGAPYERLRALENTELPKSARWREYRLELDGDMERYLWTINGKTLSESDSIKIKKGENVRFTLVNKSMMHHPMHLHGHFFRVVNSQGGYSPLKHTVDIPPFETRVIEFAADKEKDWFFHCHVLYHMKSGMHQIVHYEGSEIAPDLAHLRHMLFHDHLYFWGNASFLSQMTEGKIQASNERNDFTFEWKHGLEDIDVEGTPLYSRYIDPFTKIFAGAQLEKQESRGVVGLNYKLPLLIESRTWLDTEGDIRISLAKHIPLYHRVTLGTEVEYDSESRWEGEVGLEYLLKKDISLIAKWHSDYGFGAGIDFRF